MAKVIASLFFLALIAVSSAASSAVPSTPLRLLAHNQRSGSGTRSTLIWLGAPYGQYNCGPTGTGPGGLFVAPCFDLANAWVTANGITSSNANWSWNPGGRVVTSTGLFWTTSYISSNPAGSSVISDRVENLIVNVTAGTTTATSYTCVEGNFLAEVGANGCGEYSLGFNNTNDSTTAWNVGGNPNCVQQTLGGDDYTIGNPRGLANTTASGGCITTSGAFSLYTLVQDNLSTGGTLIISNGTCIGAPGQGTEPQVYAPCSNSNWMTFIPGPDAVDDGPLSVPIGGALDIPVMANDVLTFSGQPPPYNSVTFTDPVTVAVTTAPLHGTAVLNSAGPQPQANVIITYTNDGNAGTSDSFVYTVTDADGFTQDSGTVTINLTNDDFLTIPHTAANTPVDIPIGVNDIGLGITDDVTDTVTVQPDHGGSVTLLNSPGPATGVVAQYTPAWAPGTPTYTEHFTYHIVGANAVTDDAVVSVTVTNNVPNATAETMDISTKGDAPVSPETGFSLSNVLGISSSNLGDGPSTVVCNDAPDCTIEAGVVTASGKGAVRFDPVANQFTYAIEDPTFFSGTDSFQYTITDADGEQSTGTITVKVPQAAAGVLDPDTFCGTHPALVGCDPGKDVFDDTEFHSHKVLVAGRPLPQILDDSPADACVVATNPSNSVCPNGSQPTAVPYNPAYCVPGAPQQGYSYCPLTIQTTQNTESSDWVLPIVLGNGEESQNLTAVVTDGASGHCEVAGLFITYTPNQDFTGDDVCVVSVTDEDGNGQTDTGNVYVHVAAGGGGGGSGSDLPGGSSALDFWSLSLLAAASGLRRRQQRR